MASVHLSISKHSQLSSLSTGGEVIPFFFSPWHHCTLCLSSFLLPPSAPAFSPVSFIYSPSLFLYTPPFLSFIFSSSLPFFFLSHSTLLLAIPSFLHRSLLSPMLSVEQPIQQQNKAAYSNTRWLIKQDQNSAALRSSRQHHDTRLHWMGEGSHEEERQRREGGV